MDGKDDGCVGSVEQARQLTELGYTTREVLRYRRTGVIRRDRKRPVRSKKQRKADMRKRIGKPDVTPNEHREQVIFMERVAWQLPDCSDRIFAIPNGGARNWRVAVKLKAEGVKRGVPDVFVAICTAGRPGLWLELKRQKGGRTSPDQRRMHEALAAEGYVVRTCLGAEHAWRVLCEYLGRDPNNGQVLL